MLTGKIFETSLALDLEDQIDCLRLRRELEEAGYRPVDDIVIMPADVAKKLQEASKWAQGSLTMGMEIGRDGAGKTIEKLKDALRGLLDAGSRVKIEGKTFRMVLIPDDRARELRELAGRKPSNDF